MVIKAASTQAHNFYLTVNKAKENGNHSQEIISSSVETGCPSSARANSSSFSKGCQNFKVRKFSRKIIFGSSLSRKSFSPVDLFSCQSPFSVRKVKIDRDFLVVSFEFGSSVFWLFSCSVSDLRGRVPGMAAGSVDVLKDMVAGLDLPF